MIAMARVTHHDPEPVIVMLGEPGWVRRARLADVLVGDSDRLGHATRTCAELFGSYPGLALVLLRLSGGLVLVAGRGWLLLGWSHPCAEGVRAGGTE